MKRTSQRVHSLTFQPFNVPNVHYVSLLSFYSRVGDWKCTVNCIFCIAYKQKTMEESSVKESGVEKSYITNAWKKVLEWTIENGHKNWKHTKYCEILSGRRLRHTRPPSRIFSSTAWLGRFGTNASLVRFLTRSTRPTKPSSSTYCQQAFSALPGCGFHPVQHVQQRQSIVHVLSARRSLVESSLCRAIFPTISSKKNWRKIRDKKCEIYLN